jgi:hypothetical protein
MIYSLNELMKRKNTKREEKRKENTKVWVTSEVTNIQKESINDIEISLFLVEYYLQVIDSVPSLE